MTAHQIQKFTISVFSLLDGQHSEEVLMTIIQGCEVPDPGAQKICFGMQHDVVLSTECWEYANEW